MADPVRVRRLSDQEGQLLLRIAGRALSGPTFADEVLERGVPDNLALLR